MNNTTLLTRYGNPHPCYQDYHVNQTVETLAMDVSLFPKHLIHHIEQNIKLINSDFRKYAVGSWWFVGQPDDGTVRFYLNHKPELKDDNKTEWSAPDTILVYPGDKIFVGEPQPLSVLKTRDTVYVPVDNFGNYFFES